MAIAENLDEIDLLDLVPHEEKLGPYSTIHGVSLALGVPANRISRLVQRKDIKTRRLGWVWLIHRDALEVIARLLAGES